MFSPRDRAIIENLRYDPTLTPGFELVKSCLVWSDERPDGLSSDGYERLCDLWIARSRIHRGVVGDRSVTSYDYQAVWNEELSGGLRWPGFRRIELSAAERSFFEEQLRLAAADDEY